MGAPQFTRKACSLPGQLLVGPAATTFTLFWTRLLIHSLQGNDSVKIFSVKKQDNLNEIGFLSFSETTYCVAESVQKRGIL